MAPPLAPTGFGATAGDGQVTLSWNNANDASITKWQYRQKQAGGAYGEWTDIPNSGAATVRHVVGNLTNETVYTFQLRAVSLIGNGAESGEKTARPLPPAPLAPTGFVATAGDGQVTLSWNNAGNASIQKWQYQQKEGGGSYGEWTDIANSGAATVRHVVGGLTNATAYAFRLRAVNAGGNGAQSAEATATPQLGVPAAPTGLRAQGSNQRVTLLWNNPK